jgi:hypothetical protein
MASGDGMLQCGRLENRNVQPLEQFQTEPDRIDFEGRNYAM